MASTLLQLQYSHLGLIKYFFTAARETRYETRDDAVSLRRLHRVSQQNYAKQYGKFCQGAAQMSVLSLLSRSVTSLFTLIMIFHRQRW
jgi:hypothetical protein